MANIGNTIRNLRKQRNLTQDDLAQRLHVTRQTVSNYENGKSEPDLDMLVEIAAVLDTDVGTLLDAHAPAPTIGAIPPAERNKLLLSVVILAAVWVVLGIASDQATEYFKRHYGGCWTFIAIGVEANLWTPLAAGLLMGRCWQLLSPRQFPAPPWLRWVHLLLLAVTAGILVLSLHNILCGVYIDVQYWHQKLTAGEVSVHFQGFIPILSQLRFRIAILLGQYGFLGILAPTAVGFLLTITKPTQPKNS